MKNRYRRDLTETEAVFLALTALLDAADDDSATGGVDLQRGIFPVVAVVDGAGYRRVGDAQLAQDTDRVLASRRENEGGTA